MMRARGIFWLAAGLFLAAFARDRVDIWIDDTRLPPLALASSVQVVDRDGALLRAYTVADGRWRLAVTPGQVDPAFATALMAYEAEMRPRAEAVLRANRGKGPDAVMQMVEDRSGGVYDDIETVIPRAELAAHAEKYKRLSGFSVEILNAQPPIIGAMEPAA